MATIPSSSFITPSAIFCSRKSANFSPNCRQPYMSKVKSSRPNNSGSVCLSNGMKPVLISATPTTKVTSNTHKAAMMDLGNLSDSVCLSRRYTADNKTSRTYAGAFQCGKVGRVSEKIQNRAIIGKAMHRIRRWIDFSMLSCFLSTAITAMMANTKFTGLL